MTLFDAGPDVRKVSLVRLSAELARSLAGIGRISVEGEVHRPQSRPGGRVFFTLKDRAAQITVTCPANRSKRCRVVAGERVQVTGTLEWVSGWGSLQLVAEEVVPVGAGAVAAMIAEARRRLAADGLLDRRRKPIPKLPRAIGVVCGSDAAVRKDIESVVAVRFPGYPLMFREVTVSGPGAADAVTRAIDDLDRHPHVDVIVLARGGGDAAQLLPFSDEDLCRAICASSTPVVSAVGHEGDRPLCDEVADLRAGTPSLAASAVVPDLSAITGELDALLGRRDAVVERRLADAANRLARLDRTRAITLGQQRAADRLNRAAARLRMVSPERLLAGCRTSLAASASRLEALNPQRVLERGYAVVRTIDDEVVRSPEQVQAGDDLVITVAAGVVKARV